MNKPESQSKTSDSINEQTKKAGSCVQNTCATMGTELPRRIRQSVNCLKYAIYITLIQIASLFLLTHYMDALKFSSIILPIMIILPCFAARLICNKKFYSRIIISLAIALYAVIINAYNFGFDITFFWGCMSLSQLLLLFISLMLLFDKEAKLWFGSNA